MSRLWQSHHEILQYICKLISLRSVKIISKSLDRKDVRFGLDREHVFIVDCHFVCKRESFFMLIVAQFLSQVCLRVKADFFLPE